jgi:hypothetical protein
MARRKPVLLATFLLGNLLLALQTTGCGTSKEPVRTLLSISIAPATADAQNFTDGQVQFTATGTFSRPPSPAPVTFVAPYSGQWFVDPAFATLVGTATGTATFQCVPGASGTTTVTASASVGPDGPIPGGGLSAAKVSGTAKLICP